MASEGIRRAATALFLPVIVFPAAALTAILIGWLLHQARFLAKDMGMGEPSLASVGLALFLVLAITIGGFVAASRGKPKA